MTTNQKIDALGESIGALRENMNERFDHVEERLDEHDKKLDEHTEILKAHSDKLVEHDENFKTIGGMLVEQKGELMAISQRLDLVTTQVNKIPAMQHDIVDLQENALQVNLTLLKMQQKDDLILDRLNTVVDLLTVRELA